MGRLWQPQEITVYKAWVDSIIMEASDELNAWELSFVSNIERKLISGRNLTEAQAEVLEKIYAAKTK